MSDELYKRFRPKKLETVDGQDAAVKMLRGFGVDKMPHAILFCGPSGCGKTTLARIAATQVGCDLKEVVEVNCAEKRGIELARDLWKQAQTYPLIGNKRVWILDEYHQTTKEAQSAMLKLLEDTPSHAYFFLCTTDPQKILPTIVGRCTQIKIVAMTPGAIKSVLGRAIRLAKLNIGEDAIDRIVNESSGSARVALVILNQIKDIKDHDEQAEAVTKASITAQGIDLAKILHNPRGTWAEAAAVLKALNNEDIEGVRYLVLAYARNVLLGGGKLSSRAALIIERFGNNFYDSKAAGLALAAYEVLVLSKNQ